MYFQLKKKCLYSFILNKGSLWTNEWSNDELFTTCGISNGALVINIESKSRIQHIWTGKSDVFAQQISSKGDILFNGSRDGLLRSFDLRADPKLALNGSHFDILKHKSSISCLKLMNDEIYILSSSMGEISKWDRRMCKVVTKYEGHVNEYLTQLKFAVDNSERYIVAGGQDKYLRIWSQSEGKLLHQLGPFDNHIYNVALSDNWVNIDNENNFYFEGGLFNDPLTFMSFYE